MSSAKYAIAPSFCYRHCSKKAQGWLTEDDLRLLLEGQRDIARIRANNQSIARQAQLQATLLRLLDITLLALAGRL
ncbi:Putative inner membrane protein [Klebsiella aerogenes]|nr:Putative inner membrane protein [Klebsiella aerogenes]